MIEYRPTCKDCGENLEGDGYKIAIHCPNVAGVLCVEPDAGPFYCGWDEPEVSGWEEEQQ